MIVAVSLDAYRRRPPRARGVPVRLYNPRTCTRASGRVRKEPYVYVDVLVRTYPYATVHFTSARKLAACVRSVSPCGRRSVNGQPVGASCHRKGRLHWSLTGAADAVLVFLPFFKGAVAQIREAAANGAGQRPASNTSPARRYPCTPSPRPSLIGSQSIGLAAINADPRACWIASQTPCCRYPYLVLPSRSPLTCLFHSQNGYTALCRAAGMGHAAVAEILLDRGAEIGHENKVRRPFFKVVVLFGGPIVACKCYAAQPTSGKII